MKLNSLSFLHIQNETCTIVRMGNKVLCTLDDQDVSDLQCCTHEEADTGMLLHATYAVIHGL